MSRIKLKATAFRSVAILLVFLLALEFVVASPVQALNYNSNDSVLGKNVKKSINNEWNFTQKLKQLLLANSEEDAAQTVGDASQEEGPMLANDIIVYLESGTMGTMSVKDDSSGTGDQNGIPDDVILMAPQPGETIEQALDRMRSSPGVAYVEPNYLFCTQYYYGYIEDPRYSEQWALEEIDMEAAWSNATEILSNRPALPVIVAVIDTGVDWDHVDFQYIDPELETMSNRVLEGYNVINDNYGRDAANDDSYNGHGTHIAGIIAAATNNDEGIAGTAGGFPVSILPIKALGSSGTGTMLDIAEAIYYAVDYAADAENELVINLSLGARLPNYPKTLADAVKYAQDNGAVVVAAAGNDGGTVDGFYPACLPGVISVGATDKNHEQLYFSNRGPDGFPTVVAPGKDIISTLPGEPHDRYGNLTGTSQAAAFVSGTAALLFTFPDMTSSEVSTRIRNAPGENGVFNASIAVWPSDYNKFNTLEIINPADDGFVSGVVDIIAIVGNPENAAQVYFEIWNVDTRDMVSEGTVSKEDESGQYI